MFSRLLSSKQKKFLCSEDGATAIEYGLIAAGISVAIAAAVFALGGTLDTGFDTVRAIF